MASYASASAAPAIVRQGARLIVPVPPPNQFVILPALCVRCGAAGDGKPVKKTFYWHHPALFLLLLVSPLIYAIVAIVVRKSVKLQVPLCAHHAKRRSTAVMLAWLLPLIGVADIFILNLPAFNVDGGIIALVSTVFILAGLIIWAIVNAPIRPKKIDQSFAEFGGCCEIFLQQFPQATSPMVSPPPQQYPPAQQYPPPPPPIR